MAYHRMPMTRIYTAAIIRVFRCVSFGCNVDLASLAYSMKVECSKVRPSGAPANGILSKGATRKRSRG